MSDSECGTMLQDVSKKLSLQHVIIFFDYLKIHDNVKCAWEVDDDEIINGLLHL